MYLYYYGRKATNGFSGLPAIQNLILQNIKKLKEWIRPWEWIKPWEWIRPWEWIKPWEWIRPWEWQSLGSG